MYNIFNILFCSLRSLQFAIYNFSIIIFFHPPFFSVFFRSPLIHLGIMNFMLSALMMRWSHESFSVYASSSVRIATETKAPHVCESPFQSMIFPRWKCKELLWWKCNAALVSLRNWKILSWENKSCEKHKQENRVLILSGFIHLHLFVVVFFLSFGH